MIGVKRDAAVIVVGGQPRVDLLPPEIKARKEGRKKLRSLAGVVLFALALCAAGILFATSLAVQSQSQLAEEQARTQSLLQEQLKYAEARSAASLLDAATNARLVGSATEILWREYLADVQGTLPEGVSITTFAVDSLSALDSAPELSVPLQQARVASLTFTTASPGLPEIVQWLVNLRGLPGHADSTVTSITQADGVYTANVTLNVNTAAFEKRFFEDVVPAAETSTEGEG